MTDVLCVPSFPFNLISISKLTQSLYCCFIFIYNLYSVQDLLLWKTIGVGEERSGLYLLQTPASQLLNLPHFYSERVSFDAKSVLNLWHCRLGHPYLLECHSWINLYPMLYFFIPIILNLLFVLFLCGEISTVVENQWTKCTKQRSTNRWSELEHTHSWSNQPNSLKHKLVTTQEDILVITKSTMRNGSKSFNRIHFVLVISSNWFDYFGEHY